MEIENKARRFIIDAINSEKSLTIIERQISNIQISSKTINHQKLKELKNEFN